MNRTVYVDYKLNRTILSKNETKTAKMKLYKTIFSLILTYCCESSADRKRQKKTPDRGQGQ